MVLRPKSGSYEFLGHCFVPGLEAAIGMLGPLPRPWKPIGVSYGPGGRETLRFLNQETGEKLAEDPRLSPSSEWQRIERDFDGDDPENFDFFEHKRDGDVINYDPRLDPEALKALGVDLEWFTLI